MRNMERHKVVIIVGSNSCLSAFMNHLGNSKNPSHIVNCCIQSLVCDPMGLDGRLKHEAAIPEAINTSGAEKEITGGNSSLSANNCPVGA